jgi:hypothetical protein
MIRYPFSFRIFPASVNIFHYPTVISGSCTASGIAADEFGEGYDAIHGEGAQQGEA